MSAAPPAEAVAKALQQTLQEAAFTFAEPIDEPPPHTGELLEARLGWAGQGAAELRLTASAAFAAALAANLLGADAPDPERAPDALGELLNMAAGTLVHDVFGPRADCHLGVPLVRITSAQAWDATLAAAPSRASLVEEGGHRLDLTVHPAGPAR